MDTTRPESSISNGKLAAAAVATALCREFARPAGTLLDQGRLDHGEKCEAGDRQETRCCKAADEASGTSERKAADQVELAVFGRDSSVRPLALSEIDVATPPRAAVPGTAALSLFWAGFCGELLPYQA